MTTFTAWKFDAADAAESAAQTLKQAWREGLVKVEDYAVDESRHGVGSSWWWPDEVVAVDA